MINFGLCFVLYIYNTITRQKRDIKVCGSSKVVSVCRGLLFNQLKRADEMTYTAVLLLNES